MNNHFLFCFLFSKASEASNMYHVSQRITKTDHSLGNTRKTTENICRLSTWRLIMKASDVIL